MHLDGRKQTTTGTEYGIPGSAHGRIIPVRKANGTNEVWYTIPYDSQSNNSRNTPMVIYVHSKRKVEKQEEEQKGEIKGENKGNNTRKKKEANMRSGCRPSPEDKVAVCWYSQ